MKIFEKRPLSLILCIMLGVFSLFASCALYIKIIVSSLTLAALGIEWFCEDIENAQGYIDAYTQYLKASAKAVSDALCQLFGNSEQSEDGDKKAAKKASKRPSKKAADDAACTEHDAFGELPEA